MKKLLFKIIAVMLGLLISLLICELVLITTNWSPNKLASEYMQFGYATGIPVWDEDGVVDERQPIKVKLFKYDDDLFWKTIPNTEFTNSQGFRGKSEFSISDPNSAIRILVLGDSCSFLGKKLYSDFLKEMLIKHHPERRFDIINASVPGYTSYQGEKRLAQLIKYKPHYVCIYFGWNDHWILPSGYSDGFHGALLKSFRFTQIVKILLHTIKNKKEFRVPLDDYRKNLTLMVERIKTNGAIPILISAPSGYLQNKMPKWAYKFFSQCYQMTPEEIDDIPATHQSYADELRKIAKEQQVIFVDPIKRFNQSSFDAKEFFRNDLIHLREAGHNIVADEIYNQMVDYNTKLNISLDAFGKK